MRRDTLLYIIDRRQNRVLLGMKKTKFGAGKYNAPGGQVDEGETIAAAAVRETREEVGVEVSVVDARKGAEIHFTFEDKPEWERVVYVFIAEKWRGEPVETREMAPEWFDLDKIPYDNMWIDDIHWLPLMLQGKSIDAEFHFAGDGSAILRQRVDYDKN